MRHSPVSHRLQVLNRTLLTLLVLIFILSLGGCATTKPPAPLITSTPVIVPVPCSPDPNLLPPRNPQYEFSRVTPTTPLFDKVRALLIEREQRISAEDQLWTALDGCTRLPPPP